MKQKVPFLLDICVECNFLAFLFFLNRVSWNYLYIFSVLSIEEEEQNIEKNQHFCRHLFSNILKVRNPSTFKLTSLFRLVCSLFLNQVLKHSE